MLSYDSTMQVGAARYQGHTLLITDAEDRLS